MLTVVRVYLCRVQKQFLQFIEKHRLVDRGQPVFAAVSGGIDSMVLLHLLVSTGYRVTAVHVNFGLRGAESDADENFVRERCHRWGVPVLVRHVATNNYATGRGVSIQMAARDLRYQWFHELLGSEPGSVLATAHHLNDSGETMLLNLVRGTGIDGLTGIPVGNRGVIRPLGFATRSDIHRYAAQETITWREDMSNTEDHYQRNFIRNRVMGLLKELNPSLDDTLGRNSSRLGGERELVEKSVADWKQSFVRHEGDLVRINKQGLHGFIHKAGVLLRMIEPFGFNFATAEDIVAALDGQPGKKFLTATHQLIVDRTELIIYRVGDRSEALQEVFLEADGSSARLGQLKLLWEPSDGLGIDRDPSSAVLDFDKLRFPLTWRHWKEGDHFQPLGMTGRKKVSDFLIDEKVSIAGKQNATVLLSGDEIVWLVGRRISDQYKVVPDTRRTLRLRLAGVE